MKTVSALAFPLLLTSLSMAAELPRATPESQGVDSAVIQAFVQAEDQQIHTLHSVMILRHGKVVAEGWWQPEAADKQHILWSLSKSFTSTAVGLAVAEGKLSIDDPVLKFFPNEAPANPSSNLQAMKVRDLLTMTTGHETEPKRPDDGKWVQVFLNHPVPFEPGTHFLYNTQATYMQSAIVQKVTGQTVLEYLRTRLFEPLGIENPVWGSSPDGITLGGYGLHIRTEDIAKFGQLLLQKGKWQGRQLVPAAWIEQATSKQVSNDATKDSTADWKQGYGFQFWQCTHGAYRGDGKDGQFCIVLPQFDAVVIMTAENAKLQDQLALVWDKLLPAFHDKPLPENPEAQASLKETLQHLTAHPAPAAEKK